MSIYKHASRIIPLIITSVFFIACSTTNPSGIENADLKTYKEFSIHFIDVGDGDSIFIDQPDGDKILVDAGSQDDGPGIVKYLKSIGIERIDHLIFTHPHDDHIGGAYNIFSKFYVGNIYDNGFDNPESIMRARYLAFFRAAPSRYKVLKAGDRLSFGEVMIEVLNPLLPPTGNLNEDSIVLRLHIGDIRVLLAGDMGKVGERRLLNIGTELSSHVLKVGHHGANNASSEEFLAATRPQTAVITVSAVNDYALPEQGTLNRLERAGVKIYRTDRNGHIILKTDGKVFSLHTEKALNGESK